MTPSGKPRALGLAAIPPPSPRIPPTTKRAPRRGCPTTAGASHPTAPPPPQAPTQIRTPRRTPSPTPTPAPADTTLFSDAFTEPDGQAPQGWAIGRSAAGAGSGASIDTNRMRFTVALSPDQNGFVQYVQARETSVQPSWASGTVILDWQ